MLDDNNLYLGWHEGLSPITDDFLKKALEAMKGRTVFIHCTAGGHRAPTIAIANLYVNQQWSLPQSICAVIRARHEYPVLRSLSINWEEITLVQNIK